MAFTVAGKKVGPVGFGLMGLTRGWAPTPYNEAVKVMKTALENGANFWNGGQFYGPPNANSLQLLNHYFTEYPEDAERVVLSIKGAYDQPTASPDCSPAGLRKSVEECLKILDGKKTIDIFEPARLDPKVPLETTITALAELVKEGKIGAIGLSEVKGETIRKAYAIHPIAAVETELSLFSTDPLTNGIVSACAELGIPVVAYSPLSRGWLSGELQKYEDIPEGDFRRFLPRFQPAVFDKNLKLVEEIKNVAQRKKASTAQIAISWVAAQGGGGEGKATIIPIPGATKSPRVTENCSLMRLNDEDLKEIKVALDQIPIRGDRYGGRFEALLNM